MTPVNFSWKAEKFPEMHFGHSRSYGLIAQEVERVLPEMVSREEHGYKTVDYARLPLLLLEAVRELKAENDRLKEQMKSQQAQILALAAELAEAKQILRLVQTQLLSSQSVVETAGGRAR